MTSTTMIGKMIHRASALVFLLLFLEMVTLARTAVAQVFTVTPLGDYGNVNVMEVSGDYNAVNPDGSINVLARRAVTKEFFKTHKDEYDFLVVFSNFDFQMPSGGAKAFYLGVKNDTYGIGKDPFDHTALFGSSGRLQGMIDMGNIGSLTTDPLDSRFEDTLFLLSHEILHRWGAFIKFREANGSISSGLLGSADHWSYLLTSTSVLYGNRWQDNGNGTFTSLGQGTNYSPLDLYLMGLIDKSGVPPLLLINSPGIDPTQRPKAGATITGTAKYVTIDDIIAANGERVPTAAIAPKSFRTACILLTRPGTYQGTEQYGIENIRKGAVAHFSAQTDGMGIFAFASEPTVTIPQNPGPGVPPVTPRTRPADVNEGVTWLLSHQYPDGHWEDSSQTALRDTAEAVEALGYDSWAHTSYLNGIGWLASASPTSTDYTARVFAALSRAGRDAPGLKNRLVSEQNADYGWGSSRYFASNAADTGLALSALSIGWHGDVPWAGAIDYIRATQNIDGYVYYGGWGVNPGASSGIQPTAAALRGYLAIRNEVSELTVAARFWLVSKQDKFDGGFGNGPSTVYETAIAVIALSDHIPDDPAISGGVSYLRNTQAENGSWNGSVYQTALAVNALRWADTAADLSVVSDDIVISPAVVTTIPETITITARIWNWGRSAVPQAVVALYDGDPASGVKIAEQTIAVDKLGSATVTFTTTVSNAIEHTYFISIDPLNTLTEKSKANNIAWKTLPVQVSSPIVGFNAPGSNGNEAVSPVRIPVSLNIPLAMAVSVGYSINPASTATAGSDYILAAGTLTFNPGETVKYIDLTIIDDRLVEPSETVVIDLANPVNAVPGQDRYVYTILDNDVMPAVTVFSPLPGVITSTNTPTLIYSVTPSNAVTRVWLDGSEINKTSGSRLDALNNATHTIHLEASDGVNTGSTDVTFTINYTPPAVTIRSPVYSVYTDTTPMLRYAVNKEAAISVKVDGTVVDKISGDRLDSLTDGEHIVRVEATDADGVTGFAVTAFIVYTGAEQPYAISSSVPLPIEMTGSLNTGRSVKGLAYDSFHSLYTISDNACDRTDSSLRVTKYDSSVKMEWLAPFNSYTGGGQCAHAAGIVVDENGNAYVHVQSDSGLLSYPNADYDDAYLLKLNKDGALEWSRQVRATLCNNLADSITLGPEGHIYAGGRAFCGTAYGYLALWDVYDPLGQRQGGWGGLFLGRSDSSYTYVINKVLTDNDGNVYLSGTWSNGNGEMPAEVYPFIRSYNQSGGMRWVYQNSAVSWGAADIAVDDLGGVYVTGYASGGLDGNAGLGGDDAFITKLDSGTGARKWTYQFGSSGNDSGYAITVEKNGILYITGVSGGAIAGADGSGPVFAMKGDGSGSTQFDRYWVKQFGTTGSGRDLSLGALGYVYVRENDAAANANTLHTLRDRRLPSASLHHDPMNAIGSSLTITGTITGTAGISVVKTDTNAIGDLATYPTASTWQVTVSGLKEGKNHLAVTTAKNAMGFRDTIYGTIQMANTLPTIAMTTLPGGITMQLYNQTLSAAGGMPPYTWTVTSGSLPPGLTLTSAGNISGQQYQIGTFPFMVKVTDAFGLSDTKPFSITICDPMAITTDSLPQGSIGKAYSGSLAAMGGQQPYTWSIVSGALPAGLTLDGSTGAIVGAPAIDGISTVVVQVRDINNFTSTKTLSITIDSKAFASFAIANIASSSVIDTAARTISVTVPYGTDVTYLAAIFSTTGTRVAVGSTLQMSGITANNFSSPLVYTVTSVDGSSANYTVTVSVAQFSPTISTIAGNGQEGFSGDGGPALQASFGYVYSAAVTTVEAIFISDSDNYRIRKISTSGTITTIAGNGEEGFSGDGGSATGARFGSIYYAPAVDNAGNIYIADTDNHRIRKVSTSGIITTIAGNGQAGFSGDGGPAKQASLNYPVGVAVDSAGNLYITDANNYRIRKVNTSGIITTIAGNGQQGFSGDGGSALQASFSGFDSAPTIDLSGNIYIADGGNYRIRKINFGGVISTIAGYGQRGFGGDDGPALQASFGYLMSSPVIDSSGNIYIADNDNHRIRKVDTGGVISTIAGNGQANFSGDGGPALLASLNYPNGVAVSSTGNIYITDTENFRIRKVMATSSPVIGTAFLPPGTVGTAYSRTLSASGGTAPYSWTRIAGTLPAGLTLSTSGMISGTPTTAGTSTVTVQVKDTKNATNTKVLTISVYTPLNISTSTLAFGTTGMVYSQTLAATGGLQPYSWSTTAGALPAGLALNDTTGVISGTPTSAGISTFTVQVMDTNHTTSTKFLSISVFAPLSITTTTLSSGITGSAYSQTLTAIGGLQPYVWTTTTGTLPNGLALNSSTGVISGMPTTAGTVTFVVQVMDQNAATNTKQLSISVVAASATANGDLNGDGVVDAADVLLAQRIAMGIVSATPEQLSRGDVAPIGAPDGVINAGDVVVIQRKVMDMVM